MASEAEIERLRREADTIMTRLDRVEAALEAARNEDGEHWETGTVEVTLTTPRGEQITVGVGLDAAATESAQQRYERAKELETELKRERSVVGRLAPLPADPVAYRLCFHLETVEGNYPRSMAGHLDAERDHVEGLCSEMEAAGLIERIESGTVKRRQVKAKQADEVRQHHTYYRLARDGDHLLRFLEKEEGRRNVLRHLPDGRALVERLARGGPDYPRMTADELELDVEYVRHLYRALRGVGLVTTYEGATIKEAERRLKPKPETHRKHTYYVTTAVAERLLRELDD